MQLPNIFVYTHDSVAVGEDGPTHQPVEQLTNLRTTPNLATWRPCDTWKQRWHGNPPWPVAPCPRPWCLRGRKVSAQARSEVAFANVKRGGYVLYEPDQLPHILLIATGSEVSITMAAANPCWPKELLHVLCPCPVSKFLRCRTQRTRIGTTRVGACQSGGRSRPPRYLVQICGFRRCGSRN